MNQNNINKKKPELLSPAGSIESVIAAVENGADSVYFGTDHFNARLNAPNIGLDTIRDAIDYCHLRDVKAYAVMNTLIADWELRNAVDTVRSLYNEGIDVIVIQDIGFAHLIHHLFPDLAIHASTQMTIHNTGGASFLKNLGFKRVILSREVSIEDTNIIRKRAGIEIETFIHGALCLSYSGQCLMSSFVFQRSGNFGVCAQPCRLRYALGKISGDNIEILKKPCYLISPKDLNTSDKITELIESDIDALKIEGRMRSPTYVSTVTRTYRNLIDSKDTDINDLTKVFNRGFTNGFLFSDTKDFINETKQDNLGQYVGKCISYDDNVKLVKIKLDEKISMGDGIRIDVDEEFEKSGVIEYGCKIKYMQVNKSKAQTAKPGQIASVRIYGNIKEGSPVYKTFEKKLDTKSKETFVNNKQIKKIQINLKIRLKIDKPLSVSVSDGVHNITVETKIDAQKALKYPTTCELLEHELSRLGNTPFVINKFECDLTDGLMIPLSEIGQVRRNLIEQLELKRTEILRKTDDVAFNKRLKDFDLESGEKQIQIKRDTKISVQVSTLTSAKNAMDSGADEIIIGNEFKSKDQIDYLVVKDIVKKSGKVLSYQTPSILSDKEIKEILKVVKDLEPDNVLVSNLGLLKRLIDMKENKPEIHIDYPTNIYNKLSAKLFEKTDNNIKRLCLSTELSQAMIETISKNIDIDTEIIVHGNIPIITSEYCIFQNDCKKQCIENHVLIDRKDMKFPIKGSYGCRMQILNTKKISLIKHIGKLKGLLGCIRLDLRTETDDSVKNIVYKYRQTFSGINLNYVELTGSDFTNGWF
ncbi:MAG: DUF3656 domain-containing protein [DPANN group archaeon]|nr:DUF3656 domain-containing protein [DPANN group archaeon]